MSSTKNLKGEYRTFISRVCSACKHFRSSHSCDAFPEEDGIPVEIWTGEHDHQSPYPGDGGIQWEDSEPEKLEEHLPATFDELLAALTHGPTEIKRAYAARQLGEIGDPRAAEALVTWLNRTYPLLYENVLAAIIKLGAEALAPLVENLQPSVFASNLIRALSKIGDEQAIHLLVRLVAHEDVGLVSEACGGLLQIGSAVFPSLLELARHPDGQLRRRAVILLGFLEDERALPVLFTLMNDPMDEVCLAAADAVQRFDRRVVPDLLTLLNTAPPVARAHAVGLLGKLADERAFDALWAACQYGDDNVRIEAILSLGHWEVPQAIDLFFSLLQDDQSLIRVSALIAIYWQWQWGQLENEDRLVKRHGKERAQSLQSAWQSIDWERVSDALIHLLEETTPVEQWSVKQRLLIIHILDKMREQRAYSILATVFEKDPLPLVRAAALRAAVSLRPRASEALVTAALRSSADVLRVSALSVLAKWYPNWIWESEQALKDPAIAVRIQAIENLGKSHNINFLEMLLDALCDPEIQVRRAAILSLCELGDPRALPFLEWVRYDLEENDHQALQAISNLQSAVQHDAERLENLRIQLFIDTLANPRRSARAVQELVKIGHRVVSRLGKAWKDLSPYAQSEAARVLGEVNDRAAIPVLREMLTASDWGVRQKACEALAAYGKKAIETLSEGLFSTEASVRGLCANALGKIGDPQVFALIQDLLNDTDISVREEAVHALPRLHPKEGYRRLIPIIQQDQDWKVRSAAAYELGSARNFPEAEIVLIHALADDALLVRANAAAALGRLHSAPAFDKLGALLQDPEAGVRANAATSLGQMGDLRARTLLARQLENEHNPAVRRSIEIALRRLALPDDVSGLIAALNHPDWLVQYAAVECLGESGDERALEALETMAGFDPPDGGPDLPEAAHQALANIRARLPAVVQQSGQRRNHRRPKANFDPNLILECDVVGSSYVQGYSELAVALKAGDWLALRREPENAYDSQAILVLDGAGRKLGYVPRSVNALPARMMDAGKPLVARLKSKGRDYDLLALTIRVYLGEQ